MRLLTSTGMSQVGAVSLKLLAEHRVNQPKYHDTLAQHSVSHHVVA